MENTELNVNNLFFPYFFHFFNFGKGIELYLS